MKGKHKSGKSARRGATILVVDNSPVNLYLMRSILEPSGYHVMTASGVSEALDVIRASPPDLILSDVHMPCQDGYDLIRALKADPALKAIPFAFLSSTVWRETDPAFGLSLGADRFILRPVEPEELLREVAACLWQ